MKKILSILICLSLIITMTPSTAIGIEINNVPKVYKEVLGGGDKSQVKTDKVNDFADEIELENEENAETPEYNCECDPITGVGGEHTNKDCPLTNGEKVEISEQPQVDLPVQLPVEKKCTCDPKVEGDEEHTNKDCPLTNEEKIEIPEQPAVDLPVQLPVEKKCTCDPIVEGDGEHTNDTCPLFVMGLLNVQLSVAPTQLDISKGDIVIGENGATGKDSSGADVTESALNPYGYVITGTTKDYNILVQADTTITLDEVNIDINEAFNVRYLNTYALLIDKEAEATLMLKGENQIISGGRFAGITVHDEGSLTISCADHVDGDCRPKNSGLAGVECDNTLIVRGGEGIRKGSPSSGSMTSLAAPAIGGIVRNKDGDNPPPTTFDSIEGTAGGEITITGGIIDASAGRNQSGVYSARIGAGYGAVDGGIITISGGHVTAIQATYGSGSGIGGARVGNAGVITISGNAYVKASGGRSGAGIGGGGNHSEGNSDKEYEKGKDLGGAGTIVISENAYIEAIGGNVGGTAIGPAAKFAFGSVSFGAKGKISIADTAEVVAYAAKKIPAIASENDVDSDSNPLFMLNCVIEEPLNDTQDTTVILKNKANPSDEKTIILSKGYSSFAVKTESDDVYEIFTAIPPVLEADAIKMGLSENASDTEFIAGEGRKSQGMLYATPIYLPNVTLVHGEVLSVKAEVLEPFPTDNPPVSWEWSLDGVVISGETDQTLSLDKTKLDKRDEKKYSVIATLKDNTTAKSNIGTITVTQAPLKITAKDVALSVNESLPTPAVEYVGFVQGENEKTAHFIGYVDHDIGKGPKAHYINSIPIEYRLADGTEFTGKAPSTPGIYQIFLNYKLNSGWDNDPRYKGPYKITVEHGRLFVDMAIVRFDANGGEGTMVDQQFPLNSAQSLIGNRFTRDGYTFNGWNTTADGINGTSYADGEEVSFNKGGETTLFAQWTQNPGVPIMHNISIYKDGNGEVSLNDKPTVEGANETEKGKPATVKFNPNTDYVIEQVKIDGVVNDEAVKTGVYKIDDVQQDYRIDVKFKQAPVNTFTITPSVEGNGTISPSEIQIVTKGDEKTFIFSANSDYKIDQVLINGVNNPSSVTAGSHTFSNVQENHSIKVIFSKKSSGGSSGGGGSKPDPKPEEKPKLTTERIAYIAGYEDGSFRPDNEMTRAEVAVVLSNLIEDKPENTSAYLNFTDTNQKEWYADKVGLIVSLGIMGGYTDGSFRPYDKVTRAEFATIASNFDELEEKKEINFIDLAIEHWAHDYISMATSRNWVGGYEDGSFRPESGITRAEVVVVMNNMLNRSGGKVEISNINKTFTDVTISHWAYHPIVEATNTHEYTDGEN